jgi:hypothetical protein
MIQKFASNAEQPKVKFWSCGPIFHYKKAPVKDKKKNPAEMPTYTSKVSITKQK